MANFGLNVSRGKNINKFKYLDSLNCSLTLNVEAGQEGPAIYSITLINLDSQDFILISCISSCFC